MKMKILIIASIMLCVASCERLVDHAYIIKIQNNSKDTIQLYASYNYPDTLLDVTKPRLKMVYPSKYSSLESEKDWKDILPKDTILINILSKDTVDIYSWEVIRSMNKVLRQYRLSIQNLEKQSWMVKYP
jgi:hypothetical protein